MVVRLIVFLNFTNLIYRGTDILKCFRESLGLRDNESRLYFNILHEKIFHGYSLELPRLVAIEHSSLSGSTRLSLIWQFLDSSAGSKMDIPILGKVL